MKPITHAPHPPGPLLAAASRRGGRAFPGSGEEAEGLCDRPGRCSRWGRLLLRTAASLVTRGPALALRSGCTPERVRPALGGRPAPASPAALPSRQRQRGRPLLRPSDARVCECPSDREGAHGPRHPPPSKPDRLVGAAPRGNEGPLLPRPSQSTRSQPRVSPRPAGITPCLGVGALQSHVAVGWRVGDAQAGQPRVPDGAPMRRHACLPLR